MRRTIRRFDQDVEEHWRAMLDCGHYQHVRHDPPLTSREWVLSKLGRDEKIGAEIECRKCDEERPADF